MPDVREPFKAMRIFFTGVGGQGTLLATRLVGEAALEEGFEATMSEIHGMAQRGGVVESSVVVGNISSPTIADGEADVLLAFEPLEALRALPKCHAASLIISSTVPIVPFTVAIGQAAYPEMDMIEKLVREKTGRLLWVDALELARKAGNERGANIVMVGVFAGTKLLPVSEKSWQEALKRTLPGRLLEPNLRAFEVGCRFGEAALQGVYASSIYLIP
jgi:indolepyruvate ferredoxin oxidoreductase beta subunit